jgi:hypothetical protein
LLQENREFRVTNLASLSIPARLAMPKQANWPVYAMAAVTIATKGTTWSSCTQSGISVVIAAIRNSRRNANSIRYNLVDMWFYMQI